LVIIGRLGLLQCGRPGCALMLVVQRYVPLIFCFPLFFVWMETLGLTSFGSGHSSKSHLNKLAYIAPYQLCGMLFISPLRVLVYLTHLGFYVFDLFFTLKFGAVLSGACRHPFLLA
jgi:hypothetical protein